MTKEYRELLLGCGRSTTKRLQAEPVHSRTWREVTGPVTLDIDHRVEPDIWCDLNQSPPWHFFPRIVEPDHPDFHEFCGAPADTGMRYYAKGYEAEADYWDEIHAYQVLEHLGSLGDAHAMLSHFAELWRLLKPGGYLVGSVPSRFDLGLFGDPSHRRVINDMTLVFLDQFEYVRQCDGPRPTSMSDFRDIYRADFRRISSNDNRVTFDFVLQAVKPSRYGMVGAKP